MAALADDPNKTWSLPDLVARRVLAEVVHEGDAATGVKDPVVTMGADGYEMWLCCHPLDEPGHEDLARENRRISVQPDLPAPRRIGEAWGSSGIRRQDGRRQLHRLHQRESLADGSPARALYGQRPQAGRRRLEGKPPRRVRRGGGGGSGLRHGVGAGAKLREARQDRLKLDLRTGQWPAVLREHRPGDHGLQRRGRSHGGKQTQAKSPEAETSRSHDGRWVTGSCSGSRRCRCRFPGRH